MIGYSYKADVKFTAALLCIAVMQSVHKNEMPCLITSVL